MAIPSGTKALTERSGVSGKGNQPGAGGSVQGAEGKDKKPKPKPEAAAVVEPPVDPGPTPEELFQTALDQAILSATSNFNQATTLRGLDPNEQAYQDLLAQAIANQTSTLAPTETNTSVLDQIFPTTFGTQTLADEETRQRNVFGNQVDAFAPTGFALSSVPDTFDDAAIAGILGTQLGDTQDFITRARDRGNLSDAGFNQAQGLISNQQADAQARLTDTGNTLLSGFRDELRGIGNTASTGASGFTLGSQFDPSIYQNQIEGRIGEFGDTLSSRLSSSVGELFDPREILLRAGSSQGFINPTGSRSSPNSIAGILSERLSSREEPRGLGSTGAF